MPRGDHDRDYYERDRDRDRDRERRRRRSRDPHSGDEWNRERRRRKGHQATDSQGELLPRAHRHSRYQSESERDSPSPRKKRYSTTDGSGSGSGSRSRDSGAPLSLDALAKLDKHNAKKGGWRGYDYDEEYVKEVRRKEERLEKERIRAEKEERRRDREEAKKAEERRRAYESDVAAEEAARAARRERRRQERERERERRKAETDDEGIRIRGYTDSEIADKKRRGYTDSEIAEKEEKKKRHEAKFTPSVIAEKREKRREERKLRVEQKKRRVISGPLLEEGGNDDDYEYQYMMEKRGGAGSARTEYTDEELARKKKIKRICIIVICILIVLAIIIPVAILMSKKNGSSNDPKSDAMANASKPSNYNLNGVDKNSIPESAKGGLLDPFSWYDTIDFNVTYTDATVGGLSVMGLNSTWDDNVQANDKVPNLKDTFEYGKMPIRGVNVGGWLNIEPFITPSFFSTYKTSDGVIDEYTLTTKLGSTKAASTLEKHYSSFVTKQTFADIRAAGFDHVRIPFGYWAVTTYDGDPYVSKISWRYLLRGIEYARQNGLRVNLDLHGLPGSQNGWNHSGRQGPIGWLNGTDGDLNAQRSLDIHGQLSTFFAQPRYKNIITLYGLVNEPRMVDLNTESVLTWTKSAITLIRKNNITSILVFGDGFMGLQKWQGKLSDEKNLLLDVHQYVIFNTDQIKLKHTEKLNFACKAWTTQTKQSMDTTTGFGPTMCGEWSQADTDCTENINNVGFGNRWEGTYNTGNASTSILVPQCPTNNNPTCSCKEANADPKEYSDAYKKWLYQFAVAQMSSFEKGWGWFYWTWETEKATQWSWKLGMKAGILPDKVWNRDFSCDDALQDFGKLGLPEYY